MSVPGKHVISRLIEPPNSLPAERQKFSNRSLFILVMPVVIEQFLALLVGLADTLMVSYAGESAVSGVSLVNQINNIFIMLFTALASGGAIVASQYVGSKDKKNGVTAASQLVMATTVLSIIAVIIVLIFGGNIFGMLFGTVEEGVRSSGLTYLRISAYSFPFLALYNGCAGLYRSMGKTKTLMYVSLIMNVMNVAGNAIGIFVLHAGVEGVAYPSLVSRIAAAIMMLCLASNKKNPLYIKLREIFSWNMKMIKRIFYIAIPNSIESGLFQIAKVALSSIVALFGTVQIAANGIAQSFWSMSALFCLAMGPVFITVVGQYMGAGDTGGARYYMQKLLRITYLGGIIWNLLFFLLTPLILQLYSLSQETASLVIILVLIHNTFNAILCPAAFSLSNGLRAAGDVKYTMMSSIIATVVVRTALSALFGLVFHMGVVGVAFAMACDWAIKAVLIIIRYRSGKWQNFHVI